MTVRRAVVLDNEAASALLSRARHDAKRKAVVTAIAAANGGVVVPTAVRVEAGWDRRDPVRADANRLAPRDDSLDSKAANRAAELRSLAPGASVVDATVATSAENASPSADVVEILTSDPDDIRALAAHLGARVHVHRI